MSITGGELLVEILEGQGVERIFCSPGTEWAPVWEALAQRKAQGNERITYINCRHEMLAVSAAMGYAERTGKLPAVLLHSGIGTLHGSMALRNAYFARVPMIVLSGEIYEHTGDEEIDPPGAHWLELLSDIGGPSSFVTGYVKWSNAVKSRDSLMDLVSRGCRIARAMPRGPAFLSVPADILIRSYTECKVWAPCLDDVSYSPSPGCLEETATLLVASANPVIISEYAGKNPVAVDRLVELSEMLSIPVFEGSYPITCNFPRNHPHYMGFESAGALSEADVILVVGGGAPWYPPHRCSPDVKVILVDDDPLHENLPHWGYPVDITLAGDIEKGLVSLIELVRTKTCSTVGPDRERSRLWQTRHEELVTRLDSAAHEGNMAKPLSPAWLFHEARRILPDDALILDETITHRRPMLEYVGEPGHYTKSGYGCLGVGIGEALGAKMARPENPVILFIGDGAFNYNPVMAGLGMAQEYHAPIMIILMNNGGYVAMRKAHEELYPQGYAVTRSTHFGVAIEPAPDYALLAGVFGGYGEKLENPEEIEPALMRCLDELGKGRTVILDVLCE